MNYPRLVWSGLVFRVKEFMVSRWFLLISVLQPIIFWAVIGSISVTLVVIVAFASALFQIQHERGVAILFMVALGAFTASLVDFAREVRIALSEFDHYA